MLNYERNRCLIYIVVLLFAIVSENLLAANQQLVRGYLAVEVSGKTISPDVAFPKKQIYVPDVTVYLRNLLSGKESVTTRTDLSGRFTLRMPNGNGRYRICWKSAGYFPSCGKEILPQLKQYRHVGTLLIEAERTDDSTLVYGKVRSSDGDVPRFLDPMLNVNTYARVSMLVKGRPVADVAVNNFGEYVLPLVPVKKDFEIHAAIEGAKVVQPIRKVAGLEHTTALKVDLNIKNHKPRLKPIVALDTTGKPVKAAAPGDTLILLARAKDKDGDPVKYRWSLLENAGALTDATSEKVKWTLPSSPGFYRAQVLAYDEKGGYEKSLFSIRVDKRGVVFSGRVAGTDSPALSGAVVEIGGKRAKTGVDGRFELFVAAQSRYVLNIRKPGYALISAIYDRSVTGGNWIMTKATVVSVDPTRPIKVTDDRDKRNCPGPRSIGLNWKQFPGVREPRVQDGKGNTVQIGGAGATFDDLRVGDSYKTGEVFSEGSTKVRLKPFMFRNGETSKQGVARVSDSTNAGGHGQEMMVNNVNLDFRFPRAINQLSLNYGAFGGSLNLVINGKLWNFDSFDQLDGQKFAGVKLRVQSVKSSAVGRLKLTGPIKTFSIGGQELFIDEVKEDLIPDLTVSRRCGPGISVSIPANALVDQRGNRPLGMVDIELSTVDLRSPSQMVGDYSVRMPNDDIRVMQSYGAGSIEIRANGKEYNLRSGTEAELTIPVDSAQLIASGPIPPSIPILFYDEKRGEWFPEGQATLVGTEYKAKVKHFSTINTDLIKTDQSCVRILSPTLPSTYELEYTIPAPAGGGAAPIVRQVTIDNAPPREHVIYNLPSNTNIVLVPIRTDDDTPIGTFVVNTGGPQAPTTPNLPLGPPYNACSTEVELEELVIPEQPTSGEFLHGLFSFAATNLDELDLAVPAESSLLDAIDQATEDYYTQIDPRNKRPTLADFRATNLLNGTETRVSYANGGDLGFGRDMYCKKNWVDDDGDAVEEPGEYDIGCYVTNYGSNATDDAQDAQDALAAGTAAPPVATVAMEYSRVESPLGEPVEFDDPDRVVKFYVYKGGDATLPADAITEDGNGDGVLDQLLKAADLDGFGARPIPQLCMVCHGGEYPGGPVSSGGAPAFASRDDIKLGSVFIPFDTSFYVFPPPPDDESSPVVQAAIKSLNEDIVAATDPGSTITDIIAGMYSGPDPAVQFEDFFVSGWDSQPIDRGMYGDVVGKACRMCHASSAFPDLLFDTSAGFVSRLGSTENRVCEQHVMPHAQVTHDIFWTSVGPHMPAQLQIFGDTFGSPANGWNGEVCGEFIVGGDTPITPYEADIQPIWNEHCAGCHTPGGFGDVLHLTVPSHGNIVNHASTQSALDLVEPGSTNLSYLWHKINATHIVAPASGSGVSMPLGSTLSVDDPADTTTIENWINDGASP